MQNRPSSLGQSGVRQEEALEDMCCCCRAAPQQHVHGDASGGSSWRFVALIGAEGLSTVCGCLMQLTRGEALTPRSVHSIRM